MNILIFAIVSLSFSIGAKAGGQPKQDQVSFYIETSTDLLSISHGGSIPLGVFPKDIPTLEGTNISDMLAFTAIIRNEAGKPVGVASELEDFPSEIPAHHSPIIWDTLWTLTVQNRGTLFLAQQEKMADEDAAMFKRVKSSGIAWRGKTLPHSTTYGPLPDGYGMIIGGTGEFKNASGKFQEIVTLYSFTPDGNLGATLELRLTLDADEKE